MEIKRKLEGLLTILIFLILYPFVIDEIEKWDEWEEEGWM